MTQYGYTAVSTWTVSNCVGLLIEHSSYLSVYTLITLKVLAEKIYLYYARL